MALQSILLVAGGAVAAVIVIVAIAKRHAREFQHQHRIRIDRYKLAQRHADIEMEVFGSHEVLQAVQAYAKEHRVSTEAATRQARTYLKEIVPKFNLLAYYWIGAPVARALMHFLYRVVVDRRPLREFNDRAPKGTRVVYIINHRSNADYVLVAHMLFKFISLSYAVGEWARVWPLNHLFKWFGAYFIRRRYREPLYHAVLSKFVQTITKHGVTQGFFIEGALTRDGAFLKPKLGMLDSIVTSKRDPEFTGPLFILPTAINFDRTLEDRALTEELIGVEERATKWEKLRTTAGYLFKNFFRGLLGRFKRYGYAIVTFGEPISVDAFIAAHPEILAESFEQRKPHLQALAGRIMTEISNALPITPVPLVACIFRERGMATEREVCAEIDRFREEWRDRVWLLREKNAVEIWNAARRVLELRRLIEPAERWRSDLFEGEGPPVLEDAWRWNPGETLLRDYYANSLARYG